MRKRYWVLLGLMGFAGIGNLIGGTDTPVTASVRDSAAPERLVVTAPAGLPAAAPAGGAAPQFEASLYITANSLNLRESPSTSGRVLGSLSRNSVVRVGERRGGWVNVSVAGVVGWVSADYLGPEPVAPARPAAPARVVPAQAPAPVYAAPVQNQSRQRGRSAAVTHPARGGNIARGSGRARRRAGIWRTAVGARYWTATVTGCRVRRSVGEGELYSGCCNTGAILLVNMSTCRRG